MEVVEATDEKRAIGRKLTRGPGSLERAQGCGAVIEIWIETYI